MAEPDSSKMLHRDDLPMEVAEGMIEAIQKLHPDCKVVFAGDVPGEIDPAVQDAIDLLEYATWRSFSEGRCFDCQTKIPIPWPPEEEDWKEPDDWNIYVEGNFPCPMIICPDCEGTEATVPCSTASTNVTQWEKEGWQDELASYREIAKQVDDESVSG